MEATIKCLILRENCAIVSQVEEVDVELGEPNCKLIKPCEVHKNGDSIYLTPWLSEYTSQDTMLISSDSVLTIIDPNKDILTKYIDIIS
jgi:hypothetical protein